MSRKKIHKLARSKLKSLMLRGRNLLHVDAGHWLPSCVRVSVTETITVSDPESHAYRALADRFTNSFNLADAVDTFDIVWPSTGFHKDNTVNGFGRITFSIIKGKVPAFAAKVAVGDAKRAIPEHAQTSIIGSFFKNTFLQDWMWREIKTPSKASWTLLLPVTLQLSWFELISLKLNNFENTWLVKVKQPMWIPRQDALKNSNKQNFSTD